MLNRIILIFFLISPYILANEVWDEEYYLKAPIEFLDVNCSKKEALEVAGLAVKEKYPEHYKKFSNKGFTVFSTPYGDRFSGIKNWGELKSILGYKLIEPGPQGAIYYEESIEVFLTQDCKVLDIVYFKGKTGFIQ